MCERAEKVRAATQRHTDDRQFEVIGRVEGKEVEVISGVVPTFVRLLSQSALLVERSCDEALL